MDTSTMDQHNQTITEISTRLSTLHATRTPFRIFHGSTNSTRDYKIPPSQMIDTSSLNRVLSISSSSNTCLVEPNVSMESLVSATLPFGLIPLVVMEFRGITVGGGFSGTGAESSSFKHGSFDAIVKSIEIVLSDGKIVIADRENEYKDLFFGATGALGTLGVVTLLEVELVRAERYVEVKYLRCGSVEETIEVLREEAKKDDVNYLDGIMMAKDWGIVVSGRLTSRIRRTTPIRRFTRAQDPWFYLHAADVTSSNNDNNSNGNTKIANEHENAVTEAIPLTDYLFRYDRAAFWMGTYAFSYFLTPFNRLTRYLLDPFMQTSTMYHALHKSGHMSQYIIQDLAIPASSVCSFISDVEQEFGIWPLWLCPMKPWRPHDTGHEEDGKLKGGASFHPHALDTKEIVNVGVWGPNNARNEREVVDRNRVLEGIVKKHGGRKWLYAQGFYTKEEWGEIYDERGWKGLRGKYGAEGLKSVWDKSCGNNRQSAVVDGQQDGWKGWVKDRVWSVWPVSGVYGVLSTLIGRREYLLDK